jgi:hypothetical protein
MIKDLSNGRLDEISTFAKENGLEDSFKNTFSRLERHSENGAKVELYADFAPLSLYFEIYREGTLSLNGGMIFHGPHDKFGNGGSPTFSVCLDSDRTTGWSIHT